MNSVTEKRKTEMHEFGAVSCKQIQRLGPKAENRLQLTSIIIYIYNICYSVEREHMRQLKLAVRKRERNLPFTLISVTVTSTASATTSW
jgi:hypothetical protein